MYAAGTMAVLMKGKSYNRRVRAHKLLVEAFFRLMWAEFSRWYKDSHPQRRPIEEEDALLEVANAVHVIENKGEVFQAVQDLEADLKDVTSSFDVFVTQRKTKSKMFTFWEEYGSMVKALLQFIKAERTGNWHLHFSTVATLTPYFYAMDRPNYARWLPVYLADMCQLHTKHPQVYQEFLNGDHSVSRSGQPFPRVWSDMALEQSINADSKSTGGVVGKSQNPSALERWFLTIHERAAITTALKSMYGVLNNKQVVHKEAAPKRVRRDKEDIKKLVSCFTSGTMVNPFGDTEDLVNFATGVVLPTHGFIHHQESLSLLGQDPLLNEPNAAKCEAFICDLYPCPRKRAPTIADERRYVVFCQKKKRAASSNLGQLKTAHVAC